MKKSVALLLVIVSLFTLFSLTACKKQEKKDDNPPKLPQGTVVIKTVSENAMLRYLAIYQETGYNPVVEVDLSNYTTEETLENGLATTVKIYNSVTVNLYYATGVKYYKLTEEEYVKIQEYQNRTGRQVIYPNVKMTDRPDKPQHRHNANIYYKFDSQNTVLPKLDAEGKVIPNYWTYEADNAPISASEYNSLRIEGENGFTGEDGKQYFVCGKNHIEISEHFATNGKKLDALLTDVMLYTAEGKISA